MNRFFFVLKVRRMSVSNLRVRSGTSMRSGQSSTRKHRTMPTSSRELTRCRGSTGTLKRPKIGFKRRPRQSGTYFDKIKKNAELAKTAHDFLLIIRLHDFSTENMGTDLRSVQLLMRKHEGLERDLAALEDKIKNIDDFANKLSKIHTESAETIMESRTEINAEWTQLSHKAVARKEKLLDSYDLQRFLSDYR